DYRLDNRLAEVDLRLVLAVQRFLWQYSYMASFGRYWLLVQAILYHLGGIFYFYINKLLDCLLFIDSLKSETLVI
ncbi:hypothetical protein BMR09_15130, partial [Methylococcaceae bacterium CS3]